jgi:hypothetical protein
LLQRNFAGGSGEADDGSALVKVTGSGAVSMGTASSSAMQRLYERSYVGLEPKIGITPVQASMEEGRVGIARGYASERTNQGL